jgi:succinoglycan biosynthesis protein ExoL
MTRIAFFGHNASDAAVGRRVQAFRDDGVDVTGFMMRRGPDAPRAWDNTDLGETADGAYLQRIRSIFSGARIAADARDRLASADVIVARNLDMLATAFLAKRYAGLKTPVIYECLDVHRILTRNDPVGFIFRRIEGALLAHCRGLIVSSPGFLRNYFEVRHRGRYTATVIENRLAAGGHYGPRPDKQAAPRPADTPLRIGWVGILRCARSLDLLIGVARQLGPRVRIEMHGQPALTEVPDFHEKIADVPNIAFHGRYRAPDDLAGIYAGMDVVWAGDFMEAGYNSVWLLPNRLYEGGYYAVPPIAPAGTQTAAWIEDKNAGFAALEDLAVTLPELVGALANDRSAIATRRARLLDLPVETFVQQLGAHRAVIEAAMAPRRARQ